MAMMSPAGVDTVSFSAAVITTSSNSFSRSGSAIMNSLRRMVLSSTMSYLKLTPSDGLNVRNSMITGARPYISIVRIPFLSRYRVVRSYFLTTCSINLRDWNMCTSLSTERRPSPPMISLNAVTSVPEPLRESFTSTVAVRW